MISSPTIKPHKPGNFLGVCPHCGRPVHEVVLFWGTKADGVTGEAPEYGTPRVEFYRHNPLPRIRVIADRDRTHCSKCLVHGQWYEFKPGSGECTECQS